MSVTAPRDAYAFSPHSGYFNWADEGKSARPNRATIRIAIERLVRFIGGNREPNGAACLEDVARSLGAVDILYLPIVGHGYTQWKRGGPVIHLSLSRNDGRRRFLLAHECGHLVFDRMLATDEDRAWSNFGLAASAGDELEWVCNEFANELLIPTEQLLILSSSLTGLDSLRRASARYRISLSALVFRLNRVGRSRTLLNLRRSRSGAWVIADRIGAPEMWQGSVDLDPECQRSLTSLVPTSKATRVRLGLNAKDRSVVVDCEVRVARDGLSGIALFDTCQLKSGRRSSDSSPSRAQKDPHCGMLDFDGGR